MRKYCSLVIPLLVLACLSTAHAFTEYTLIKADPKAGVTYLNPVWSPDGKSIAYVAAPTVEPAEGYVPWEKGFSIRLATLRKGHWQHKTLLKDAEWPVWSPSGKLGFARDGLLIMDPRTGRVTRLTKDRLSRFQDQDDAMAYEDIPTSFSPDGRYLAYNRQLWEMAEIRVFDTMLNRDLGINIGNRFAWSPDSRRMLASFEWYGDQQVPSRLAMWDLGRRKWRTVLKGFRADDIVWPKGREYVWVLMENRLADRYEDDIAITYPKTERNPPDGPGTYRLDLAKHTLTKLSDISSWILPSPTYRRFIFAGQARGETRTHYLYVGETGKWQFRILTRDFPGPGSWIQRAMFVGWSPNGKSLAYVTSQGDIRIVKFN